MKKVMKLLAIASVTGLVLLSIGQGGREKLFGAVKHTMENVGKNIVASNAAQGNRYYRY